MSHPPIQAEAVSVPERKTIYPQPFAAVVEGRVKRKLGDFFGLRNFGINLTQLAPGAASALMHHHSAQDEFIFVLEGAPTVVMGEREFVLQPGDCVGFPAGTGVAHQIVNRSEASVSYIEVGDRAAGDVVEYPHDDLAFAKTADGALILVHKDGRPY